ncbi:MAG: TlpA disulfide reductase family protein [Luteolibacter sp.]
MKSTIQLAAALLALTVIIPARLAAEPANGAESAQAAVKALKVGDPAPGFKVSQWYKGDPITLDDKGTFIVECWATWCGPCVAAFPHLSEIAKANEGKITVVGVNVWEKKKPEEVKTFVDGQGDKMSYHVASDGEGVIANDWLKAAGQNGIPCAFVVSKGKVMWIGHPATLEQKLLDSIVDGSFDVAAFAKAKEAEEAPANYFNQNVVPLLSKKDNAGAIGALEKMKKEFPDQAKIIDGHIERLKAQLPKESN